MLLLPILEAYYNMSTTLCQHATIIFDKPDETKKFLEKYNLPKLVSDEAENLNSSTSSREIKYIIWDLPTYKTPLGSDSFTGEF